MKVVGWTTILLVVFGAAELVAYGVGRYLQSKGVFYEPPEVDGYDEYLAERDPLLGWPAPSVFGTGEYDETGSRIVPAFPDTRKACVSLYGDSFTWSGEVDPEHAWGNVLSKLLGCRVSNFGVGGYGSDQAYLRFLKQTWDDAPDVILAHLSENILRNVNQLRGLLYAGTKFGLKPRFVLDEDGALKAVPLPTFSAQQLPLVEARPEDYLRPEHEYFLPGGPTGTRRLQFPFSYSVLRALGHFHVVSELTGKPWHMDFYQPDHDAGGLGVTSAILEAFARTTVERGQRPIVLIIPTGGDLEYFVAHRVWPYQPLLDRLRESGIDTIDAGPGMMRRVGDRDPCELFADCSAHFNAEGYETLAHIVYEHLEKRGLEVERS